MISKCHVRQHSSKCMRVALYVININNFVFLFSFKNVNIMRYSEEMLILVISLLLLLLSASLVNSGMYNKALIGLFYIAVCWIKR